MALKIRLARAGAKKRPYYHIVIAEASSPRDGRFVEKVGTYNPMVAKTDEKRVTLNQERIKHWFAIGAQPTDRVERFLGDAKLIATPAAGNNPQKSQPKKKAQERMRQEADRLEKLAAAKAAAAAAPAPEATAEPASTAE